MYMSLNYCTWAPLSTRNNLKFHSEPAAHSFNPCEGQSSKPPPPLVILIVGYLLLPLSLQSRFKIRWLARQTHHTLTQHLSYRVYDFVSGVVRQAAALGCLGSRVLNKVKRRVEIRTSEEKRRSMPRTVAVQPNISWHWRMFLCDVIWLWPFWQWFLKNTWLPSGR